MLCGTSPRPRSRRSAIALRRSGGACLMPCLADLSLPEHSDILGRHTSLAVGAFVLVLVGVVLLVRRTSAARNDIELQLRKLGEAPSIGHLPVEPVRGTDPLAAGWNALLERVSGRPPWIDSSSGCGNRSPARPAHNSPRSSTACPTESR